MKSPQRILVTGASGALGRHVLEEMARLGFAAVPLRRGTDGKPVSAEECASTLREEGVDAVLHLAGAPASASWTESVDGNVRYAAVILDAVAMVRRSLPIVLCGSAAEYGMVAESALPILETHGCAPVTAYGATKLAQTQLARAYAASGGNVRVARLFNLVGAGLSTRLALGDFASQLRAGAPSLSVGDLETTRDFIALNTAARIVLSLLRSPPPSDAVVNVCSGRERRLADVLDQMCRIHGTRPKLTREGARLRKNDCPRMAGSTERLRTLVDEDPSAGFDEALAELLETTSERR